MADTYTLEEIRQTIRNDPGLIKELNEIGGAVSAFAGLMRDKMFDKAQEGFGGWDEEENSEMIRENLNSHVARSDWIDVANFCMMLHRYAEKRESQKISKKSS